MNTRYFAPDRKAPLWKRMLGLAPEPEPEPVVFQTPQPHPQPPLPEPEPVRPVPDVRLMPFELPSSLPQLKFDCKIEISALPPNTIAAQDQLRQAAASNVYQAARTVSSRLSLTENEQLSFRLDSELLTPRELPDYGITVWARCVAVTVNPGERELVRGMEQRKLEWEAERHEDWILERRIRRLTRVFEDPRIATLWWFAQHPDRLEDLPDKVDLFFNLDRWFNAKGDGAIGVPAGPTTVEQDEATPDLLIDDEEPEPDPTTGTDGQLLDQFLLDTDPAGRASVGIVLANLYRDHGRGDLADRIQRFAQPPSAQY